MAQAAVAADAIDSDTEALAQLDAAADALQGQGQLVEALKCVERVIVLRQHLLGSESHAVWSSCAKGASLCNELGMRYLDAGHHDACVEML